MPRSDSWIWIIMAGGDSIYCYPTNVRFTADFYRHEFFQVLRYAHHVPRRSANIFWWPFNDLVPEHYSGSGRKCHKLRHPARALWQSSIHSVDNTAPHSSIFANYSSALCTRKAVEILARGIAQWGRHRVCNTNLFTQARQQTLMSKLPTSKILSTPQNRMIESLLL